MNQRRRIPALLAFAAWPVSLGGAEQNLSEPEREPLLADSARPVEQDAGRETATLSGVAQPLTKRFVAE
jgi:hypothetical protein